MVERRHRIFHRLRLGSVPLSGAKVYLDVEFLPEFGARFTVVAAKDEDLHRRVFLHFAFRRFLD
jgi:hypothetical protein